MPAGQPQRNSRQNKQQVGSVAGGSSNGGGRPGGGGAVGPGSRPASMATPISHQTATAGVSNSPISSIPAVEVPTRSASGGIVPHSALLSGSKNAARPSIALYAAKGSMPANLDGNTSSNGDSNTGSASSSTGVGAMPSNNQHIATASAPHVQGAGSGAGPQRGAGHSQSGQYHHFPQQQQPQLQQNTHQNGPAKTLPAGEQHPAAVQSSSANAGGGVIAPLENKQAGPSAAAAAVTAEAAAAAAAAANAVSRLHSLQAVEAAMLADVNVIGEHHTFDWVVGWGIDQIRDH